MAASGFAVGAAGIFGVLLSVAMAGRRFLFFIYFSLYSAYCIDGRILLSVVIPSNAVGHCVNRPPYSG